MQLGHCACSNNPAKHCKANELVIIISIFFLLNLVNQGIEMTGRAEPSKKKKVSLSFKLVTVNYFLP